MERRGITFMVVLAKVHLLNLIMPTSEDDFMRGSSKITGLFSSKHPGHGSKRKTEKLFRWQEMQSICDSEPFCSKDIIKKQQNLMGV